MTASIRVFICYKKMLLPPSPGKRKARIQRENVQARLLHDYLKDAPNQRYLPWIDDVKLGAGVEWETKIYKSILESDVLVVVVGPGTSQSPWVQREIALANTLGISVVPIGTGLTREEMTHELRELGIKHLQGRVTQNLEIRKGAPKALRDEFAQDLEVAAASTKKEQDDVLRKLLMQRNRQEAPARNNQRAATFKFDCQAKPINIHVASGDISKVTGIDVLVNSENDYMQMARTFESRTISSMLRRLGSSITREGKYKDTIQRELDIQIDNYPRPVQPGQVFATSSGGPLSHLASQNGARYILHVAAVQSVAAEGRVVPFKQPDQIEACIRGSLGKLCEINRQKGVISPGPSDQRTEQEKLAKKGRGTVKSVIFPLFGTGQGGTATAEVLEPMFDGLEGFFKKPDGKELSSVLTDIYVSAFKQSDVDQLTHFLHARFPERGRSKQTPRRAALNRTGRAKRL